jgi:ParB family chromosome partitioning protein
MELAHIELAKLKISKCNMRYRDPPPDVSDILPSIRTKGVLQPLIVRPEDGKFGVVAGRRRYYSLRSIKEDAGEVAPPPCAIMAEGDDAEAIEASLLENTARRDPDPMREYETFVRLIKEGRTVDNIAATFGMTATQVKQRLALGNLITGIREAYRAEDIDEETVRHLTLASPSQQRKWLKLYNDPDQYAPRGFQLKQWLFGGQQIATRNALFKLSDYTGQTIEDLFGEDSYFADADLFWALQNRAIAAKRDALLKAGWADVEILEIGQRFAQYEHVKVPKKKGGKVFVAIAHDGEVVIHEGWLTPKEAKKLAKAEAREAGHDTDAGTKSPPATSRPAMTKALENYIDLHRHALVRLALIGNPAVAFRLAVAHMAAPSGNWSVKPDPQSARSDAIRQSVETSPAQAAFAAEQQSVYALLGWTDGDDEAFVYRETADVFEKLLSLSDGEVMRVAAFFVARSLGTGSDSVEAAGAQLKVDAREYWTPDDVFFDLIRDRATLNAMLAEIAGEAVARGNVAEKAKLQKQIIRDYLTGSNGRAKIENWLPGWLCFPMRSFGDVPQAEVQLDDVPVAD